MMTMPSSHSLSTGWSKCLGRERFALSPNLHILHHILFIITPFFLLSASSDLSANETRLIFVTINLFNLYHMPVCSLHDSGDGERMPNKCFAFLH